MPALQTFQLVVRKDDRLLGHFESSAPWSKEAVQAVASALNAAQGFELQFLIATDEKRIVESGPSGIKVLAREYIFKPYEMEC